MTKNSKYAHVLEHFKKVDPKIHEIMVNVDFSDWLSYEDLTDEKELFLALCRKITGQQLSVKAAKSIYKKFSEFFDNDITTEKILKATDQQLRDTGISWAKVKYIKDLAAKVENKQINLAILTTLSDEEVTKELVKIKGIGEWTAEMFLMFNLKRENIFSHGDLGLKNGLIKIYKLKNPDLKKIEKIVSKWQPYKTFGSISLWHSLDNS
jgi:DNA-3-methyladenine glycosylase II